MRVTVVMTLHNKGPFVEEAVRSILDGSFRDLELLVVDDGSTDDGPERVRGIEDPRVRLLHNGANLGRPAAANRAYDEARGEYLAILDADDIAAPDRLVKQVAYMDAHPEVGVCGTWVKHFGEEDHVVPWPTSDREIRGLRLIGLPLTYGSCIIRRSVMEEHHIRADVYWTLPGFDYFFMMKFAPYTTYANIPEVLTHYRVGEQNMRVGRDPLADRTGRLEKAFTLLGVPTSDGGPHLLALLEPRHDGHVSAVATFRIHAWLQRTIRMNHERQLFDQAIIEGHLLGLWDQLQRRLWRHGPWTALAYMICSRRWLPHLWLKAAKVSFHRSLPGMWYARMARREQ